MTVRRTRLNGAALTGFVLLLVIPVVGRAVTLEPRPTDAPAPLASSHADDPDFGEPTPSAAEEDSLTVLVPHVDITVSGTRADSIDVAVLPSHGDVHVVPGQQLNALLDLTMTNTGAGDIVLQVDGDTDLPTFDGGGLIVSFEALTPADVLHGWGGASPDVPVHVGMGVLPPDLPRSWQVDVTSTEAVRGAGPLTLPITIADGVTLTVDVSFSDTFTPALPDLQMLGADPGSQQIAVPDPGEAAPVLLAGGTPMWVVNTRGLDAAEGGVGDVVVVDARSTWTFGGVQQLVGWCASAQGFTEGYSGARFGLSGDLQFGPGWTGLLRYDTRPTDESAVVVVGDWGLAGRTPATPPAADDSTWDAVQEGDPPPSTGPWCDATNVAQGFPLELYPQATLGTLPSDGVAHLPRVRVHDDGDGQPSICQPRATPGCADSIPVSFDGVPGGLEDGPAWNVAYDIPLVVRVENGVVVAAWSDGEDHSLGMDVIEDGQTNHVEFHVTRLLPPDDIDAPPCDGRAPDQGLGDGADGTAGDCGLWHTMLQLQFDDRAVWATTGVDPAVFSPLSDGRLPDHAIVIDRYPGQSSAAMSGLDAGRRLGDGTAVDQLPFGDLVILETRGGVAWSVQPLDLS